MLEPAARVGDPVEHSHRFSFGMIGAIAGVALGVALVVLTAPISLPAIAAAGVIGGTLMVAGAAGTVITSTLVVEGVGETIGSHVAAPNAGDILDGAHSVFTGPGQPKAARMSDPVKCHSGESIAEGSDTVFIENWNASRKGDATTCAGKIQDGCASVLIGGNPIGRAGTANRSELPVWFQDTKWGLDWANTILGFVDGKGEVKSMAKIGLQIAGAGVKAYGQSSLPGAKAVGYYGGAIVAGAKLAAGGVPTSLGSGVGVGQSVVGQGTSGANYFCGGPPPHTY
jgi:uncharacterized Zn-binding protein involved in type VI secretion